MLHPVLIKYDQTHWELIDLLKTVPTPDEPCDGEWRDGLSAMCFRRTIRPNLSLFFSFGYGRFVIYFNQPTEDVPPIWQQYAKDIANLLNGTGQLSK
jgi:hypothetical protein